MTKMRPNTSAKVARRWALRAFKVAVTTPVMRHMWRTDSIRQTALWVMTTTNPICIRVPLSRPLLRSASWISSTKTYTFCKKIRKSVCRLSCDGFFPADTVACIANTRRQKSWRWKPGGSLKCVYRADHQRNKLYLVQRPTLMFYLKPKSDTLKLKHIQEQEQT